MPFHSTLLKEKWHKMSLAEQLGNIGSEVSRTMSWQNKDEKTFQDAAYRALELFDFTLEDSRWQSPNWSPSGRLREIARTREVFCDTIFGDNQYKSPLKDLLKYFDQFAIMARSNL